MDGHESLNQTSGAGSQWDSVAALAGKMGQLEDVTEAEQGLTQGQIEQELVQGQAEQEPVQKRAEAAQELARKQAEALAYIDGLDFGSLTYGDQKKVMAHLDQYGKEIWSDEFIDDALKTILARTGRGADEKIPAYLLMHFGMPASVVLKNPEYYNELLADGDAADLPMGTIGDFYREMSTTEEGREQFRKDFVESGMLQADVRFTLDRLLGKEFDDKQLAEILSMLKLAKESGLEIIDDELYFLSGQQGAGFEAGFHTQGGLEAGRDLANLLYTNGLFSGDEVAGIYKQMLTTTYNGNTAMNGMLEVALEKGIQVSDEHPDAQYWHRLFAENGQNMIDVFVSEGHGEDAAKMRQEQFDFTVEPVMRLFALREVGYRGSDHVRLYQSPQFRKALRDPALQDIILSTIDAYQEQYGTTLRPTGLGDAPSLFLMLAQDREVLESMHGRGAFEQLKYIKSAPHVWDILDKLDASDLTDEDIVSLFTPSYLPPRPEYFEPDGTLTYEGAKEVLVGFPYLNESVSIKPEISQELFKREWYDLLPRLSQRDMDRAGFDATTQTFLKAHRYARNAYKFLMKDGAIDAEKMAECFDEAGQPTAFFAEEIFKENRWSLDKHPELVLLLSPQKQVYMKYFGELKSQYFRILSDREIEKYFDESGPKPAFWDFATSQGEFDFLGTLGSETLAQAGFDQTSVRFLNGISGEVFSKNGEGAVNKENIVAALARFIKMDAVDWDFASKDDLVIKEAFGGQEAKDLAMGQLRQIYEGYLNADEGAEFPRSLQLMAEFTRRQGGVGPLSQIEAFLDFAGGLASTGESGRELTATIEQKMQKNHWSIQEKSNFYAISAEVIQASPDLYHEFAELFANIPNKDDFRTFTTEIYPLYRAKLALLRDYEDHSNGIGVGHTSINYNSVDMEALKNQLHTALLPFNLQELDPSKRAEGIKRVREIILGEISELFQSKFGILPEAIPGELSRADSRAIEDMTLYLANLADPSAQKKDLIGYFLALQLGGGGAWQALREGKELQPGDMLNVVSAFNVSQALEQSRANNPVNAANTRIAEPERLAAFRTALQGETVSMRLGSVQTIDLRLQNLIGNIEDLTDPDLYPARIDAQRVDLLRRYPVKAVGRAAATLHQRLNGREIVFSEGDQEIADAMVAILSNNGIEVTPENVNNYFQSGLKGIKEPFNIAANIEKDGAKEAISELQRMLTPPDEIVQIFGRMGEEFRPQSGVMAVGADLDFLENLLVKKSQELSEAEYGAVKDYIGGIRGKMAELDKIYERATQNFEKMKKSIHESAPEGVKQKIAEIDAAIADRGDQSVLTATCTTEITTIIENMRACLSAKTKGINNDTDLTFGEGYKFYLYSNSSASRDGSVADEIVYFVPVGEGAEQRMGFVMDQVYGTKNSDILMNHLETILKKARGLKEQFPEVPISVILPGSSMASCSVSMRAAELKQKLESAGKLAISDISGTQVTVPESGFGDHYIEFGNSGARTAGPREIEGIEIRL